jgi:hypothetical protein
MRLLAQFVAVPLLVGFVGAYFWWIVAAASQGRAYESRSTNRWCGGTIGETRTYRYAFGELQFLSASGRFAQRRETSTPRPSVHSSYAHRAAKIT